MKKIGLMFVAGAALAALAGCATVSEWCANPENAKAYGGYEKCVKSRTPTQADTY